MESILKLPEASYITPEEFATLGLNRFVVIDFETTGVDPKKDYIIELGAVRYEGGLEVDRYSKLVGIDVQLDPFITRLTSITDEDLEDQPHIDELMGEFLDFLDHDPIVGQNVQFDIGFLEGELKRLPNSLFNKWKKGLVYDTLILSRTFFPTLTGFSLGALARTFEVDLHSAHRAVHDAAATGEVFLEILRRGRRTPYGQLSEMTRIIAGSFALTNLIEGLIAIGPGNKGVHGVWEFPDNLIGDWGPESFDNEEYTIDSTNSVETFFDEEGPLKELVQDYQKREGQVEMSSDVLSVLTEGGTLIAEAETGTGKSFAYLYPAIITAKASGNRVLLSTNTRHLQNQLFEKDLPSLDQAMKGGIRAALLKGRGNYVCRRRYEAMVADPSSMNYEEKIAILPLVKWINDTKSGDISEIPAFIPGRSRSVWSKISADSGFCSARTCRGTKGCFLNRIRSSAYRAHVVLINHALLFSDLASDGGVLGEYDRLICDEAHHLEKTAANHLGISYSLMQLRGTLFQLYEPKSKAGLLKHIRAFQFHMTDNSNPDDEDALGPVDEAIDMVEQTLTSGDVLAKDMDQLVTARSTSRNNGYSRTVRYSCGDELFEDVSKPLNRHRKKMEKLLKQMRLIQRELDELDVDEAASGDDVFGEYRRLINDVAGLIENYRLLTGEKAENTVYWYEEPSGTGRGRNASTALYGAPLDVGEILNKTLYPKLESLVLTSATLAVNKEYKYISGRLGINDYIGGIYKSPFDIRAQLHIAVADFLGNPKADPAKFTRGIGKLSYLLPKELDSGTLVLFTSRYMMNEVYDLVGSSLDREGWLTLLQGTGSSQSEMLRKFRDERKSVLFGVSSFWEGIDVPGESLELAIIARLPFDVPTDPLVAARSEKISSDGGNPFMEYSLPEAALKLRQGIGRLIRKTDDVGVAVICDSRITQSRWGAILRNSLPVTPVAYRDYDEMLADMKKFLKE